MILLELKYSMLTSAKKRNQAVEYLFNSDTKKIMFLDSKIEKSHM